MNRTAFLSFISLIIFCVIVGQILPLFASYTSTKNITSFGIIKEKVVEPTRIKKHVVAYVSQFTDDDADFIASNFDVVITGVNTASTISKIKALNPNITILLSRNIMAMHSYYEDWAEVDSHEDWFLHDVYGNRLVHNGYGWYAMDVGNAGWQSHFANFVKGKLDRYLEFDGVFADDTWDAFLYQWTVPREDIPPEIGQRWHNDMLGMIQTVKSLLGDKFLVLNTVNNDDYVDAADGKMFEHFVHKRGWALDYYGLPSFDPLEHMETLAEVSGRGKIFLALSGADIPDNPTQDDLDKASKMMLYCFAFFLLGVNGEEASFGFNLVNFSNDYSLNYCSEFDAPLGSPINDYYLLASVYSRDFEEGKVLVNPTTSSYIVDLDTEYKTLDGQTVSNVTLDAHSGIILLRM